MFFPELSVPGKNEVTWKTRTNTTGSQNHCIFYILISLLLEKDHAMWPTLTRIWRNSSCLKLKLFTNKTIRHFHTYTCINLLYTSAINNVHMCNSRKKKLRNTSKPICIALVLNRAVALTSSRPSLPSGEPDWLHSARTACLLHVFHPSCGARETTLLKKKSRVANVEINFHLSFT